MPKPQEANPIPLANRTNIGSLDIRETAPTKVVVVYFLGFDTYSLNRFARIL